MAEKKQKFGLSETGVVRTRFAPSPTGFLHIGGVRTALFDYLFARRHKGTFILRIEDTDIERSKPEFEDDIINSLKWVGIDWDEGPVGKQNGKRKAKNYIGEHGPYRQSERTEIYKKYLKKLLDEGKAYFCFCTVEELEAKRQEQMSRGVAPKYDGRCASLSQKEVEKNLADSKRCVIRLKVSEKKVSFHDLIRGKVEFDASLSGDFVIAKGLGVPLFYLAGAIDDYEMKITHVLRGEEHISNTPKQILIQEALGLPQPIYGHLPLILASDKSKLSKRNGAVSAQEYKQAGYLPEAMVNFLAFLGWNPGTDKEIYSLASLIKEFSIEKAHKGGAVFNIKKLDYLNGYYIRNKPVDELVELDIPYLVAKRLIEPISENKKPEEKGKTEYFGKEYVVVETGEKINIDYLKKAMKIYQARLKKLSEFPELVEFLFKGKIKYEKNLLKWKTMGDSELKIVFERLQAVLAEVGPKEWRAADLEKTLLQAIPKINAELKYPEDDRGYVLWPLRVALCGQKFSAGPFEIAEILGKDKSLKRIKEAEDLLP